MQRVLVSACLLGHAVRYNGTDKKSDDDVLARWTAEGRVVAVCPEVAGGLPVPRPPAEIQGGPGGLAVLAGTARVVANTGQDVTAEFVHGAEAALEKAREHGIRVAVLKEGSPSCGSSYSYDGTFSGARVPVPGVTTALLQLHGVRVFSEAQWAEAEVHLREHEASAAAAKGGEVS
jgi:uncharacterized protein YbbK (DUF523 family)